MYSIEEIKQALSFVNDPDLKKDLVSLNMIDNIQIKENQVSFDLVLTTLACPFKENIKNDCIKAIHQHVSDNLLVEINLKSSGVRIAQAAEQSIAKIKHIIAVAAGKGGVGKSTVAANLAVALAKAGAKTGLVDADIYGPSVPIMFDLQNQTPLVEEKDGKQWMIPIEKYGVKLMSIGFFVKDNQASVWRGPMISNVMRQLIIDTAWDELDYLVVDLPPGTGDIQLTLAQIIPHAMAILVTTPQQVALADVRKAASMFNHDGINMPLLGVVENMSYFTPAELPDNKYYIFGKNGGKLLADELNAPLLAQIPIVQSISESGDKGCPVSYETHSISADIFNLLASKIVQEVAIRTYNNTKF